MSPFLLPVHINALQQFKLNYTVDYVDKKVFRLLKLTKKLQVFVKVGVIFVKLPELEDLRAA